MSRTDDVLDAIDGARAAVDAMRWQPPESRPPRAPTVGDVNQFATLSGAFVRSAVDAATFAEAMRQVTATLSQASWAVKPFCWCRFGITNRRTECHRRSAMHAAYHHRTRARARRRRNR